MILPHPSGVLNARSNILRLHIKEDQEREKGRVVIKRIWLL